MGDLPFQHTRDVDRHGQADALLPGYSFGRCEHYLQKLMLWDGQHYSEDVAWDKVFEAFAPLLGKKIRVVKI